MLPVRATVSMILWLLAAAALANDEYTDGWGPVLNQPLPQLSAPDHSGRLRTFENLTGDPGLLLFLNRSADW